jgi:hypothetical protein
MKSADFIGFSILGSCVLLLPFSEAAVADSWAAPSESRTFSENGRFLARSIPVQKGSDPFVIVLSVPGKQTNEIWRTRLSNKVSPSRVYLSDDGESVVTLDNWGGIGYGDDVVAIYCRKGLLAKYSLEQFAPPPKGNTNSVDFLSRDGYRGVFSHSIQFFYSDEGDNFFCLWLDWDDRWAAWRLDSGSLIKVSGELSKRLNVEGRKRSLSISQSTNATAAALNFLGRMRVNEDRSIVENWLHDREFSGGSVTSSSSDATKVYFAFTSWSYKRDNADRILARWDGLDVGITRLGVREDYRFLGTLKCSISFVATPRKQEGDIRLYLIPSTVPLNRWSQQRPEHYLIADLSVSFPYDFINGQIKHGRLGPPPDFIIYGITPGQYRLKAIWSRATPPGSRNEVMSIPRPGDYESVDSPVIRVSKGMVAEGIHIDCTTLVDR